MKALLGKKIGMSQIFNEDGSVVPITLVEAGPCRVLQVKTKEKDGYEAVQLGFCPLAKRKITKSKTGKEFRYLREFRGMKEKNVGDTIDVDIFQEGEKVAVSGISKGKGFQGTVKRWGFSGRNASHGAKHEERKPGSVGSSYPERVVKGKKMAGRMGGRRVVVRNLKIVKVDRERHLLALKGAVPGPAGTVLEIRA